MAKRKLRIAQFVTSQRAIPTPKGVIWAPIDLAVDIADGMVDRGHEVTFYAPPSPKFHHKVVSGKLGFGMMDPGFTKSIAKERENMPYGLNHVSLYDQYLLGLMFKDSAKGKYDVLHVHVERALPFVEFFNTPALLTFHDPINPYGARAFRLFKGPNMHMVSISYSQRKPAPDLNYAANVYNGINVEQFAFNPEPKDKFLFCGRLVPQKGIEDAVRAARRTRQRLDVVGRHYSKSYLAKVKKLCTNKIRFKGNMDRSELPAVYGDAKALLFPIKWEEPFGLVMAEAMACGTPVIAYDRGSVREVVKHGVTGYIVKDVKQMAEAIRKIDRIDRKACRKWVERKFSTSRMVDDYEKLYMKAHRLWGKRRRK